MSSNEETEDRLLTSKNGIPLLCTNDAISKNFENHYLLFYSSVASLNFQSFYDILVKYFLTLILAVIVLLILYVIYKSYFSPVLFKTDITDIGFDHFPKGPSRKQYIARARATRQVGHRIPPPYPNGWFALAESKDLKNGGVMAVDVLGQNLCLYRGTDGVARCVDAYCPHLGANLAVGGNVCGDCIECPFHKWRFGATGNLVSVPGLDQVPKGVSIKTWRIIEVAGAIWIWYDIEGREPFWTIPDVEEYSTWGYRGRNEYIISSHVQDIPENGSDMAHLNIVHSQPFFTDIGDKYPVILNFIGRHSWSAEWTRKEGHVAFMRLLHDYKIGKIRLFHMDVEVTQIGPGHVRLHLKTPLGPMIICQSVTPIAPLQQRVVHRFFSPTYNAPLGMAFVKGEMCMFDRDAVIWNNKRYVSSPIYVLGDKTIKNFRAWFSQFYSEKSISFKDATTNTLEW